ncbi:unnamed protein product, partial [Schistosoma turkestanicum]
LSRRSPSQVFGRNDYNTKVIFDKEATLTSTAVNQKSLPTFFKPGDYVVVEIVGATSQTLQGKALGLSTLRNFCGTEWHSVNTAKIM